MSCVNTKTKEFKETTRRLNISSDSLELIVHEFQNTEGNENKFPNDSYIIEELKGESMYEASDSQITLWKRLYSKPIVIDSLGKLNLLTKKALKIFPKK